MTKTTPKDDPLYNPHLSDPDRPIYMIFRLMRQLADNITNVGPLTPDQSMMAAAVAHYADQIYEILIDGLAEIGKLMAQSDGAATKSLPYLGRLIQHLSFEAQLMQEASADYRDASLQPCRQ